MADLEKKMAEQFIKEYYSRLDSAKRAKMHELYHATATMNFEKDVFKGKAQIQDKFNKLGCTATGAARIAHNITSWDASWTAPNQIMTIFVTGSLKIDENKPLQFAQVLVLANNKSWALQNDMFRFVYSA